MASSRYRVGRAFEYRVRDRLRTCGYVVIRAAVSRGPVDLVALRQGRVLFVQCKRRGTCPPAEWNALWEWAQQAGAVPLVADGSERGTVTYWQLVAPKDGTGKAQPRVPYPVEEVS